MEYLIVLMLEMREQTAVSSCYVDFANEDELTGCDLPYTDSRIFVLFINKSNITFSCNSKNNSIVVFNIIKN